MTLLKVGRPSVNKKDKAIASVQEEDDYMRMNINIQKAFYKKVKKYALDSDKTVREIVIQALEEHISKNI